jgi:hypothetical protein
LVDELAQASEIGPGLLVLPELVMGHGQEGQRRRGTRIEPIGCPQGLDRLPVSAAAVQGRPEADAIPLPIGSQAAGVLGLEQGEAILDGVEEGWRTRAQLAWWYVSGLVSS